MRSIINGKLYDTEAATCIGRYEYRWPGDFEHFTETLYQKEDGELFLHGRGEAASPYGEHVEGRLWGPSAVIIPEHDFDAKEWVSKYCDVGTYIRLFGPDAE